MKNWIYYICLVLLSVSLLTSCKNQISESLQFPIYENEEFFIISLLFSEYKIIEIFDSTNILEYRKQKYTNNYGLDSIVITSKELPENIVSVSNTIKNKKKCIAFENFNLRYGVFKDDTGLTVQLFDNYGNLLSSCEGDYCQEFSYSKKGNTISRILNGKGITHNFVFDNESKLINVNSSEGIIFEIRYNKKGQIRQVNKTDLSDKSTSFQFNMNGEFLTSIYVLRGSQKKEFKVSYAGNLVKLISEKRSIYVYDGKPNLVD